MVSSEVKVAVPLRIYVEGKVKRIKKGRKAQKDRSCSGKVSRQLCQQENEE
jgi:hypothetical protein